MSFVLMRNIGGTQVGNPGGTKNFFAAAYCQIIYGIVPVCGFGHFASGCKFNALSYWSPTTYGGADYSGLVFDDQWPNVYQTLVESLTDGTNTSTRTITYTQTIDNLVTYSLNDPNGWFDGIGDIGFESPPGATTTIGPTSLNIQWTSSGTHWTYTAGLSNQLSSSSWATWTAQANALIVDWQTALTVSFPAWNDTTYQANQFGIPPIPGGSFGWAVCPYSTTPYWGGGFLGAIGAGMQSASWGLTAGNYIILAAANGMAARISCYNSSTFWGYASGTGMYSFLPDTPVAAAYEQDEPNPSAIAGATILQNCGAVVCATSRWMLLGLPPAYPVLTDNNVSHLSGTWCQPMTVAQPPYFTASYPAGPAVGIGVNTFTPAQVAAVLGTYGMMGFRHP